MNKKLLNRLLLCITAITVAAVLSLSAFAELIIDTDEDDDEYYTLSRGSICVTVAVIEGQPYLTDFSSAAKTPAHSYLKKACQIPLADEISGNKITWKYAGAENSDDNGEKLTVKFNTDNGPYEIHSVWQLYENTDAVYSYTAFYNNGENAAEIKGGVSCGADFVMNVPAETKISGTNGMLSNDSGEKSYEVFTAGEDFSNTFSVKPEKVTESGQPSSLMFIEGCSGWYCRPESIASTVTVSGSGDAGTGVTVTQGSSDSSIVCPGNSYCYFGGVVLGLYSADSAFALAVLQHCIGYDSIAENNLYLADVNGDGKISVADALNVLLYSVDKKAE